MSEFVRRRRAEIVHAVLAPQQHPAPTIGMHLRIEELLDVVARSATTDDAQLFRSHVETIAARIDGAPALREAITGMWSSMDHLLDPAGSDDAKIVRNQLKALELEAMRLLAQHITPHHTSTRETFDEVDAAIENLVARLDVSSPLTAEHSRAVSAWSARLARRMSLSDEDCNKARRGGLIHDVGKATTPADILDAPRSLTPEEWTIMRSHTTAGAALVESRELLTDLLPAVRSHHERLDGKGYPDGLNAAQISLSVRIVTVADCFNAMVGRRPYRAPMPPTRALEELFRHRGTQFDPDVVDAMIGIVDG